MELLIGTMCFGAITFYGYLMAKYIDAREERRANMYHYDTKKGLKKVFKYQNKYKTLNYTDSQ